MTLRVKVGSAESAHYIDLEEGQEMPVNIPQDSISRTLYPWQRFKGAKLVAGKTNKGGKIVYSYRDSSLDNLQMGSNIKSASTEETKEESIIKGQSVQIDGNLVATGTD